VWVTTRQESASILREFIRIALVQTIVAILLLVGLEIPERFLIAHIDAFASIRQHIETGKSTYFQVLPLVAEISGVFLGLYFTAVSVVVSTAYVRVPADVRGLWMQEKVGNVYIQLVALLGAAALLLLASNALGWQPGVLNLALVTLLAVAVIFGFVVLGLRAFHFLDPAALTGLIARDLFRLIRAAVPGGFQWANSAFQNFYQRRAEELLTTFRHVVTTAVKDEVPQGGTLRTIGMHAIGLLAIYAREKPKVPTESYWFKRTYKHGEWLTSDHARVDIALRTGTSLQPEVVPDMMWFEDSLGEILQSVMTRLLDVGDFENAARLLEAVAPLMERYGTNLIVDEGMRVLRYLSRPIHSHISRPIVKGLSPKDLLRRLNLVDQRAVAFISLILGLGKMVRASDPDQFSGPIAAIKWQDPNAYYKGTIPRLATEQVELIRKGLAFERAVEGATITPFWYQTQLVAQGMARMLEGALGVLLVEEQRTFPGQVDELIKRNSHLIAAHLTQRGFETDEKLRRLLGDAQSWFDRFSSLRRVEDIPWPTPPWEDWTQKLNAARERLIVGLAQVASNLAAVPRSPDLPDYFGHAYTVLSQACYDAMADGNESQFREFFPTFFTTTMLV
jgi:hypothetical protein